MVHYSSWAEMLKVRDELHTAYIREYNKPNTKWEVVFYSKWSDDFYVGCAGWSANTLEELMSQLERQGYDTSKMDVCTYKEV